METLTGERNSIVKWMLIDYFVIQEDDSRQTPPGRNLHLYHGKKRQQSEFGLVTEQQDGQLVTTLNFRRACGFTATVI